jgi:hypothetical protein
VISELHPGTPRYIELFNGSTSTQNLAGLQVQWAADGNRSGAVTLGAVSLRPGELTALFDPATPVEGGVSLGTTLQWSTEIAVRLLSSSGAGIDFIRTGTSVANPPAGTTFTGASAPNPSVTSGQSLVRAVARPDTNTAADWSLVDRGSPGDICASGRLCGDTCKETSNDDDNCGACGVTCNVDETCRAAACVDAFGAVWFSELRLVAPAGIELHNPTALQVLLSGFRLEVRGASTLNFFIPAGTTIPAGGYLFFEEGTGDNDARTVYLGSNTVFAANMSASLFDDGDVAMDFVRFGTSSTAAPAGTSWFGNNVQLPVSSSDVFTADVSAVRNIARLDSDSAADWVVDGPSTPGYDCAAGLSLCDARCEDILVNPDHCGACDEACSNNETCIDGACTSSGGLVISRLSNTAPESFELHNGTSSVVNLAGSAVEWVSDGGSGAFTIPSSITLAPGARVVLREESGASSNERLFMDTPVVWSTFIAVALRNSDGVGVDFVRTGTSATPAPAGTSWNGATATNPGDDAAIGRDAWSADTNSAADWSALGADVAFGTDCSTGDVCGGACVTTSTDADNCGSCGEVCSLGTRCGSGACGDGLSDGDIRLVGGASSGRLEIFFNGAFGTVCDDGFGAEEARVACRELGFADGVFSGNSVGSGEILLDNVECIGTEGSLLQCSHQGIGLHNCGHTEDVAVTCTP